MLKPLHHSDSRLIIALALLVIGLVTFAATYFSLLADESISGQRACTEEAKVCPGGTTVSRTGPNCEFTPCPSTALPGGPGLTEEPIVLPGTGGKKDEGKADKGVMCTQEVKMCSDGSYVGRTGPNCAFAPCPNGGGDFFGL
jgi:hypothetical protein